MFTSIRTWPELKRIFNEFIDLLRQWYALTTQDEETKAAIQSFVESYKSFCEKPPLPPHIERGKTTPLYKNCLYLHNLLRRTEVEQKKYLEYLQEYRNCDYQEDILDLASQLAREYLTGGEWSNPFVQKAARDQLFRDAKRALTSLTREQKRYLHDTNAFDHVSALLTFLVQSSVMLNCAFMLPRKNLFFLNGSIESQLTAGGVSEEIRARFEKQQCRLSDHAELSPISGKDDRWSLSDSSSEYLIERDDTRYSVSLIRDFIRVAIVVPIHKELARMKPLEETLSGEDFFFLKIKQLEFLITEFLVRHGQNKSLPIQLGLIFAGDENMTCEELVELAKRIKEKYKFEVSPTSLQKDVQVCSFHRDDCWLEIHVIQAKKADRSIANSKSSNVKMGMEFASKMAYDYIGYTDADISTNLGQLGLLLCPMLEHRAEVVIASRRLPDSWVFGRDPFRTQQSQIYNLLAQLFLGISFTDTQAGFKLFSARAAKELVQHAFTDDSMAFDSELLAFLESHGFAISEVPIVWSESPLESQSTSLVTAFNMLQGLYQQSKKTLLHSQDGSLGHSTANMQLQKHLISLGKNSEFHYLTSFCMKYYRSLQPFYIRQFVDSLKTLLYALSRNELTEEEFQEFLQVFREVMQRLPEARAVQYILGRYPELMKIAHAVWLDYKLLGPVLCFLLGSEFVSQVWPQRLPLKVPSYYEFVHQEGADGTESHPKEDDLSRLYHSWWEIFRRQKTEESRYSDTSREILPTTVKGRRASVRKLLAENKNGVKGKVVHLVVPAMVIPKGRYEWAPAIVKNAVWEINAITTKIGALKWLFLGRELEEKPVDFEFHLISGLTKDMMSCLQDQAHPVTIELVKLREAVRQTGVGFSFYIIDPSDSNSGTTKLIPYHFNGSDVLSPSASISIVHPHRDVVMELSTQDSPKGTLLFMGFNAAYQAVKKSGRMSEAFIGYTVATMKIPLEEYVFLLDALLQSSPGNHPRRVAVGSRRHSEAEVANKPLLNHLRSAVLNLIIRALFPDLARLSDSQASCKLFTPKLVSDIFMAEHAPFFHSSGTECDVEMLQLAAYHGSETSLLEVPISYYESEKMKESLGGSESLGLVTALLKLKGLTPNVNQKPVQITHGGIEYSVEYIGSGTEHMVFKLIRVEGQNPCPVIVKIPHEAIDTEFFLPFDSLCFNRLRVIGLSKTTTRTDPRGLVTNNVLFRSILSSKKRLLKDWIAHLRSWNEFNTVVLKIIRAYEGKTYKSSGYRNGLGVHDFVVPYRILSEDEYVVIPWGVGETKPEYHFDGRDHVIVMDYVEDSIEDFLRRRCEHITRAIPRNASKRQDAIGNLFKSCIETVYAFSTHMAQQAHLYDLDMNLWADIGIPAGKKEQKIYSHNLRLLDPGELESLSSDERQRCVDILWERLRDKGDSATGSVEALKEILNNRVQVYSGPLFDTFQFKQLDILMEQYGLGERIKAEIHATCVTEMKNYLKALVGLCDESGVFTKTQKNQEIATGAKNYWCVFTGSGPNLEQDRIRRQVSAVMLGGDVQGKFTPNPPTSGLDEFAVYMAQRGICVRSDPKPEATVGAVKEEADGDTLLVGRKDVVSYGKDVNTFRIPQDSFEIPYRGAIAPAINVLLSSSTGLSSNHSGTSVESMPRLVLLDAGVASRMSVISMLEGTKGNICLDGSKLWQEATQKYGTIANQVERDDLIFFGAADTLINLKDDSLFVNELKQYFSTADPKSGHHAGIFFFQPPYDENKRVPIIPQSRNEQERWLLNFVPAYLKGMRPFVPFLHLYDQQRIKLEKVDESGHGIWFRDPTTFKIKDTEVRLPAMDWARAFFRYMLISNAIKCHGGLRYPILFILSKPVVKTLYQEFFRSVDASAAEKLDWYNTILVGLSSIEEQEFIKIHVNHLGHYRAQSLYRLLQKIKLEFWSEYHQNRAREISTLFYQEVGNRDAVWYAFESPVDLFNYHYLTKSPKSITEKGLAVKIFIDSTGKASQIKPDGSAIKDRASGKTLAVVVAGDVPEGDIELKLTEPITDVASRSNFYPYLVYFTSNLKLSKVPPIQIGAHELCILTSSGNQRLDAIRLPLEQLSKEETMKTNLTVSTWNGQDWETRITGTIGDLLRTPEGVHWH